MAEYHAANDSMAMEIIENGNYDDDSDSDDNFDADEIIEKLTAAIISDNVSEAKRIMKSQGKETQHLFLQALQPIYLAVDNYSWNCLDYFMKLTAKDDVDGGVEVEADIFSKEPDIYNLKNKYFFHLLARRLDERSKTILKGNTCLYKMIDEKNQNGVTALMLALERENTEAAKFLVNEGADCFRRDSTRKYPILVAIVTGQLEVLQVMVKKIGEDFPSTLDDGHHTFFYYAALSGQDKIFVYLAEVSKKETKPALEKELKDENNCREFLKNIIVSGMKETMEILRQYNQKLLKEQLASFKITPLIWAVQGGHIEMINTFSDSKMMRKTNELRRNIFHYAAEYGNVEILNYLEELVSHDGEIERDIIEQKEQEQEISPNLNSLLQAKDNNGCTPFHRAAINGLEENVQWFLSLNVETAEHSIFHCKQCIRVTDQEILMRTIEEIVKDEKQLNAFHQSRSSNKLRPVDVVAFAGRIDILTLLITMRAPAEQPSDHHNWSILHTAVAGKSLETVKFVIQSYPDMVHWLTDDKQTPGVLAAESCAPNILKYILENGGKVFGQYPEENLLDCALKRTATKENRESTVLEIIKFCDKNGGVSLLKKLMANCRGGSEKIMCKIVEHIPSVAVQILDRCTEIINEDNQLQEDPSETTRYHFFPLQDTQADQKLTVIQKMIDNHCDDCLGHNVVIKFIDKKWNSSTTRLWYLTNILLYFTFLLSMTTYAIYHGSGSHLTSPGLVVLSVISVVVIVFNFVKEMVQMFFNWKDYFYDPSNYVEWMIYTSAIIYLLPINQDKTKTQIEAGAISIFLAWINFIWFFKRLSLFGIYIIMAKKIFLSLLKVLPMVILFIFAFSIAFFLLMSSHDFGYKGMFIGMLTTSVMMAGEVDYRDVFLDTSFHRPHIILERLFLVLFLLIITIVIMNLLVGLAVGDTDDTMKRSKAEKRFYKASLIVALQQSLLYLPFNRLRPVQDPLDVNQKKEENKKSWYLTVWNKIYLDTEVDDVDEIDVVKSHVQKVETSIKQMKASIDTSENQVKQMKGTMDDIKKMLETLTEMKKLDKNTESSDDKITNTTTTNTETTVPVTIDTGNIQADVSDSNDDNNVDFGSDAEYTDADNGIDTTQ